MSSTPASICEGDYAEAAWALAAAVPGVGDAAKLARVGKQAAEQLVKHGDEVAGGTQRLYVTYTKTHPDTGAVYVGRSSGEGDPRAIVAARDGPSHHMTEQGYGPAELDRFSPATLPYANRHADPGYQAIRGREQQMIDRFGGAASDRPAASMSGNSIRGVAADNPLGPTYHDAATRAFGEAHPYTGN